MALSITQDNHTFLFAKNLECSKLIFWESLFVWTVCSIWGIYLYMFALRLLNIIQNYMSGNEGDSSVDSVAVWSLTVLLTVWLSHAARMCVGSVPPVCKIKFSRLGSVCSVITISFCFPTWPMIWSNKESTYSATSHIYLYMSLIESAMS